MKIIIAIILPLAILAYVISLRKMPTYVRQIGGTYYSFDKKISPVTNAVVLHAEHKTFVIIIDNAEYRANLTPIETETMVRVFKKITLIQK
jgi:hypothetical protein